MSIKTTVITSTLVAVISAGIGIGMTRDYLITKHQLEIVEMVRQHERAVLAESEKLRVVERQLDTIKEQSVRKFNDDQQKIKSLESRVDALLRDGTIRLRDPNRTSCPAPKDSTTRTTDSDNGTGGSELPEATARFLWGEASRADALVVKLTACQHYVREVTQRVSEAK